MEKEKTLFDDIVSSSKEENINHCLKCARGEVTFPCRCLNHGTWAIDEKEIWDFCHILTYNKFKDDPTYILPKDYEELVELYSNKPVVDYLHFFDVKTKYKVNFQQHQINMTVTAYDELFINEKDMKIILNFLNIKPRKYTSPNKNEINKVSFKFPDYLLLRANTNALKKQVNEVISSIQYQLKNYKMEA